MGTFRPPVDSLTKSQQSGKRDVSFVIGPNKLLNKYFTANMPVIWYAMTPCDGTEMK